MRPVSRDKVEKSQPEIEYQPIVTCADITMEFDKTGISDWVEVQGYCYAPNLPTPPTEVDWVITGAFLQNVRLAGRCDPKHLRESQLECRLPWCREGKIWREECPNPPAVCMRRFGELTQRWHGLSLKDATIKRGLCSTTTSVDNRLQQIQILECLANPKN